jgi:hypothetical protein
MIPETGLTGNRGDQPPNGLALAGILINLSQ